MGRFYKKKPQLSSHTKYQIVASCQMNFTSIAILEVGSGVNLICQSCNVQDYGVTETPKQDMSLIGTKSKLHPRVVNLMKMLFDLETYKYYTLL